MQHHTYVNFLLRLRLDLIPVTSPPYLCPSSVRTSLTFPFRRINAFRYCSRFFTRGFLLIFALCATRPRFFITIFPTGRSASTSSSKTGYLGATAYLFCLYSFFCALFFLIME